MTIRYHHSDTVPRGVSGWLIREPLDTGHDLEPPGDTPGQFAGPAGTGDAHGENSGPATGAAPLGLRPALAIDPGR